MKPEGFFRNRFKPGDELMVNIFHSEIFCFINFRYELLYMIIAGPVAFGGTLAVQVY